MPNQTFDSADPIPKNTSAPSGTGRDCAAFVLTKVVPPKTNFPTPRGSKEGGWFGPPNPGDVSLRHLAPPSTRSPSSPFTSSGSRSRRSEMCETTHQPRVEFITPAITREGRDCSGTNKRIISVDNDLKRSELARIPTRKKFFWRSCLPDVVMRLFPGGAGRASDQNRARSSK